MARNKRLKIGEEFSKTMKAARPVQENVWYNPELKAKLHAANQRMRELEKRGIDSPAYKQAQATLEMMGVKRRAATGRRFSETAKGTWNQLQQIEKAVDIFLGSKSSKITGIKKFQEQTWKTANKDGNLSQFGITKKDYFDFWSGMPSNKKDRLLGSDVYITILKTLTRKGGKTKDDQAWTAAEIAEAIKEAKSAKEAYKAVGLTYRDIKKTRDLGAL